MANYSKITKYTLRLKSLVKSAQDDNVKQEIASIAKSIADEFKIDISQANDDNLFDLINAGVPSTANTDTQSDTLKILKTLLSENAGIIVGKANTNNIDMMNHITTFSALAKATQNDATKKAIINFEKELASKLGVNVKNLADKDLLKEIEKTISSYSGNLNQPTLKAVKDFIIANKVTLEDASTSSTASQTPSPSGTSGSASSGASTNSGTSGSANGSASTNSATPASTANKQPIKAKVKSYKQLDAHIKTLNKLLQGDTSIDGSKVMKDIASVLDLNIENLSVKQVLTQLQEAANSINGNTDTQIESLNILKQALNTYGTTKTPSPIYQEETTIPEPEVATGELFKYHEGWIWLAPQEFIYTYSYGSDKSLVISKDNTSILPEAMLNFGNMIFGNMIFGNMISKQVVPFTKITADTLLNFNDWDAGIAVATFKYWMDAHLSKDPNFKPDGLFSKIFSLGDKSHVVEFISTMIKYHAGNVISYDFLETSPELIAKWIECLYENPDAAIKYLAPSFMELPDSEKIVFLDAINNYPDSTMKIGELVSMHLAHKSQQYSDKFLTDIVTKMYEHNATADAAKFLLSLQTIGKSIDQAIKNNVLTGTASAEKSALEFNELKDKFTVSTFNILKMLDINILSKLVAEVEFFTNADAQLLKELYNNNPKLFKELNVNDVNQSNNASKFANLETKKVIELILKNIELESMVSKLGNDIKALPFTTLKDDIKTVISVNDSVDQTINEIKKIGLDINQDILDKHSSMSPQINELTNLSGIINEYTETFKLLQSEEAILKNPKNIDEVMGAKKSAGSLIGDLEKYLANVEQKILSSNNGLSSLPIVKEINADLSKVKTSINEIQSLFKGIDDEFLVNAKTLEGDVAYSIEFNYSGPTNDQESSDLINKYKEAIESQVETLNARVDILEKASAIKVKSPIIDMVKKKVTEAKAVVAKDKQILKLIKTSEEDIEILNTEISNSQTMLDELKTSKETLPEIATKIQDSIDFLSKVISIKDTYLENISSIPNIMADKILSSIKSIEEMLTNQENLYKVVEDVRSKLGDTLDQDTIQIMMDKMSAWLDEASDYAKLGKISELNEITNRAQTAIKEDYSDYVSSIEKLKGTVLEDYTKNLNDKFNTFNDKFNTLKADFGTLEKLEAKKLEASIADLKQKDSRLDVDNESKKIQDAKAIKEDLEIINNVEKSLDSIKSTELRASFKEKIANVGVSKVKHHLEEVGKDVLKSKITDMITSHLKIIPDQENIKAVLSNKFEEMKDSMTSNDISKLYSALGIQKTSDDIKGTIKIALKELQDNKALNALEKILGITVEVNPQLKNSAESSIKDKINNYVESAFKDNNLQTDKGILNYIIENVPDDIVDNIYITADLSIDELNTIKDVFNTFNVDSL